MTTVINKNSITIQRQAVKKAGGFVILPLKEYDRLREQAIPTYYLQGKEARELDKLVEEGKREYREGKTISATSIREALKIYGKKSNKKD